MYEWLGSARAFMRKAIKARDLVYRGMDEARQDFEHRRANGLHLQALSPSDAQYRWMQSQAAKELMADNRWHMLQADMYSNLATATGIAELLEEQRVTNRLLVEIRDKLA